MAYYASSALLAGQSLFNENIQAKGEWRLPDIAAFQVANKGMLANPSLGELRTREDRAVHAYMPIRQAATNGVARAHAHTGAAGDSIDETITWSTFSEPFSISIKQADNNVINWPAMYAATLRNAVLNLMSRADAWFVAAAVADKTQYNAGGGNGAFNASPDNYEVPASEADYLFQNAKATLEFNLYNGQMIAVMDSKAKVRWDRLLANGANNALNLQAVNMGGIIGLGTTRSILGTDYAGSLLMWENGLVGVIPWIPKQNRKPLNPDKAMEYNGDYGMFAVPELGIEIALHEYAVRADGSMVGGYTQDVILYGEVSIDLGYVSAPLSTFRSANDSVVYSIGQLPS
jgi:hypothetical protein